MKILDFTFTDQARSRIIPVRLYLPKNVVNNLPMVIFNAGYQGQDDLSKPDVKFEYKNYEYLAKFFTDKNFAFASIQHDVLGDNDGLEKIKINHNLPQYEARKHLYIRGTQNILFVINELKHKFLELNLDKFIIAGYSNGGDIAKYFANLYPDNISHVIVLDARRCIIEPYRNLKILMFEANDTSTDLGVIPDQGIEEKPKRINLEWVIIKPKNAFHKSYSGLCITEEIKQSIFSAIDWFLKM
nr:alpha/beta hydrolase [Rickettsia endosymbiont of Ceutorhynchus assimilis]